MQGKTTTRSIPEIALISRSRLEQEYKLVIDQDSFV